MKQIKRNYASTIEELENIRQAIRENPNNVDLLLNLSCDYDYLSCTNSQIDNLILESIENPKQALYNLQWCIDLLENHGAIGDEYYL